MVSRDWFVNMSKGMWQSCARFIASVKFTPLFSSPSFSASGYSSCRLTCGLLMKAKIHFPKLNFHLTCLSHTLLGAKIFRFLLKGINRQCTERKIERVILETFRFRQDNLGDRTRGERRWRTLPTYFSLLWACHLIRCPAVDGYIFTVSFH